MTTSVAVVAPAQGTYTVVVVAPSGSRTLLNYTFTAAGQTKNATYGSSSSGFKALVNQVGTYNVFVEQGTQVVSSTSFYATNKLVVSMDMVTGGTCDYIAGQPRGEKFFPRFYITYASNGAPMTNNTKGWYVTYTLPDNSKVNATWHKPTVEAPNQGGSGGDTGFFIGKFQPTWNYTNVGPWSPVAVMGDAAGNTATYRYIGPAFLITPAQLATSIQIVDATTGQTVTGLYNGQGVVIKATITYPTNPEPVSGFVGPLDAATRGGSVAAQVGWGFYNRTSGAFGGTSPGGLLGTVLMTYTGSNGTWTGQFKSSSLPTLPTGANYEVVISSTDKASPSNTGFATSILPPATLSSLSTTTTTSTQTIVQTIQSIPTVVYAALAILLILGVLIGYIVRVPR
jgi:hypothetical protein